MPFTAVHLPPETKGSTSVAINDLSSYAGPAKSFRLIDCASRMGDFPESGIKITGATGRYAGTSVVYTGRGVRLRIPCGTVVLLR